MSTAEWNPNDKTEEPAIELSRADCDALDALVEASMVLAAVTAEHRHRSDVAVRLLSLLDEYEPEDKQNGASTEALVKVTLARIADGGGRAAAPHRPQAMRLVASDHEDARPRFPAPRFHLQDAIATAASVAVLVSITGVMLSNSRTAASRHQCRSNLHGAALAFTDYAGDHRGQLPQPRMVGRVVNWRSSRANAAGLFTLAADGYASLDSLACPRNPDAGCNPSLLPHGNWQHDNQISFSYQNVLADTVPMWDVPPRIAVLGDRNPLIDQSLRGVGPMPSTASSFSHDQTGQNILFNDGSAEWSDSPMIGSDNIWLPADHNGESRLRGVERPASANDSMLVH